MHDPPVDRREAKREYGSDLVAWDDLPVWDALVLAVAHSEFLSMPLDALATRVKRDGCVIDVKSPLRGLAVWPL